MTYFSSYLPLVRVLDLSEGENLVGRRLLNLLDPATVVVNSVAASAGDVVVHRPESRQLNSARVSGRRNEDGAVKFSVSAAVPNKGGRAVSHHQDDALPAGGTVILEVARHNQQAITGVRAQIKAAVNVNCLGIGSGHIRGPRVARSRLPEIISSAAIVVVLRIGRVRNNHVCILSDVVNQLVQGGRR